MNIDVELVPTKTLLDNQECCVDCITLLSYSMLISYFNNTYVNFTVALDYKVDPTDLHLSCLEAFTFDYIVKWPISLVISRKVQYR